MESGYAPVDGLDVYYEVHGEDAGPEVLPLVLIPGGLQTIGLSFGGLLPGLAASRRVIAVELQGHGHTPDADRDLSIGRLAADIVQVLAHLGIARADFLGFSLGGLVSLEVAVTHPDVVGRLVLAATHYLPDAYLPEITDEAQTSPRLPTAEEFEAMLDAFVATAPDPEAFERIAEKYQPVVHHFEGWTADQLRALPHPTLLVLGDFDFIRLEHAVEMHALIPHASLAVLPRTRHTEVIAHPAVPGFVEAFLADD